MKYKHYSPKYYVVFRFTSKDVGKTYVFRNRFDGKIYSFELLDSVSVPVAEINEELINEFHFKPNVAVEQIWCRIKPDFDPDSIAVGFDEQYFDLYTEDADGPAAIGLQTHPNKDFGENVFMGSAMKKDKDFEIQWKLEIFAPEDKNA